MINILAEARIHLSFVHCGNKPCETVLGPMLGSRETLLTAGVDTSLGQEESSWSALAEPRGEEAPILAHSATAATRGPEMARVDKTHFLNGVLVAFKSPQLHKGSFVSYEMLCYMFNTGSLGQSPNQEPSRHSCSFHIHKIRAASQGLRHCTRWHTSLIPAFGWQG